MNKQMMVNQIASQLAQITIPVQLGNGADITIFKEFLDAKWGSGNKKIEFQASAFANENEQTLYYWEFTKETGSGFSFGSGSDTGFQSGVTLYRKVKSVGYGLDGKAFEYSLDIGSITRIFKESAKQYGWKFKVVLSREKASYPVGYVANELQQKPTGEIFFCSYCGTKIDHKVNFCSQCGNRIE